MSEKPVAAHYSDEDYGSQDNHDSTDQESRGFLNGVHVKDRPDRDTTTWQSKRCLVLVTLLNVLLFISSATMLGTWYYQNYLTKNPELRRVSIYSPVLDSLDLDLHTIQVNGTLFPPPDPPIARQMPNPAADAEWHDYEKVRPIPLTRSQILKLGKDPETVAKFDDSIWGLGDDAYIADLDVFHQLHCLNTLRTLAYAGYYNKTTLDVSSSSSSSSSSSVNIEAVHVNHCVDMLFTAIKCSGNVGFITSNWLEGVKFPQPDMSVNRKCIDFDRLVEWRNLHSVDLDKYQRVMMHPKTA